MTRLRLVRVLSAALPLLVCGCAYQPGLEGTPQTEALAGGSISLEGVARYDEFYRELVAHFHARGVTVVEKGRSRVHLALHELRNEQRTLTLGRDARTRDVELLMTARFSLEIVRNGKRVRHGPYHIETRAVYEYDDLQRLAGINELRRVRASMTVNIARRILARLARLS